MTEEEIIFGPLVRGLLIRLRQGDLHAADMLWDIGSTMPLDQRQQLEKLVNAELDKLGQ